MIEITNFLIILNLKLKKRNIRVISIGYNKKSDIKIVKVKKFLKYKLLTIKSFKKEYKIKIKGSNY